MRHRNFKVCVSLGLALWQGLAMPISVFAQTDWYTLKANGQVIGKVGIHSYPSQAGMVTEVSNVNHFTRQGSPFELNTVSRFVESVNDNRAIRFNYQYDLGEQRILEAQGQLNENTIDLRMLRDNIETSGQTLVSANSFLFPGGSGIQKVYQSHFNDQAGRKFRYQTLHLGVQPQVVDTEVTPLGREKLALAGEESRQVRKFELMNPAQGETSSASRLYEWRDAKGKLYKSQSVGVNGMEMVYASQREVREVDRNTVDLVNASAVFSHLIPQPRVTNEALYKISPLVGQSIALPGLFPTGLMQTVLPSKAGQQDDSVYLKVKQVEPKDSLITFPVEYDARYLQASPYLQVSDPELDQLALKVVAGENRAYYAARKLRQWVYQNIAYKDLTLGFASAKETYQRRQGDCTEHAVLLASLLRSLGIPSRVAVGLIYLPDQDSDLGRFVYHMWTEAYVGNVSQGDWVPLDATNSEPMPDATHIKLADSALSDLDDLARLTNQVVGVMGKIRLDVVKALSPAQSVMSVETGAGITSLDIPKLDINRMDIQALSRQSIQHYRIDLPPASLSADTANGLFTSGMKAQGDNQGLEALRYFRQALGKVRHPLEMYQLGEQFVAIGQYDLAREALSQARQKDETLAPLVANWFSTSIPEKQLSDDLKAAVSMASLNSHLRPAEVGSPEVCKVYEQLREKGLQSYFPVYRGMGQSCRGTESIAAYQQALALNPDDFQSLEGLGDAYTAQKQYAQAVQAYQDAIVLLQSKVFARSKPWLQTLKGKQQIAQGAARLAHAPKDAMGWMHVGKGLLLQNRNQEAKTAFENALLVQPSLTEAVLSRFQIALAELDWKRLNQDKARVAGLAASNAQAARMIAVYQMRTRQYAPAQASIQRVIALSPANGEAYQIQFEINQRLADQASWQKPPYGPQNQKRYELKAENALKKGWAATSDFTQKTQLAIRLGEHYLKMNRAQEANQLADWVLLEDPLNGRANWLKGKAGFYEGKYDAARQSLKRALILLPNDPDTLVALGQIAQEEGRDSLALDFYQKAYKADRANADAALLLRNLMTQLQMAGTKPPVYKPLSADAHDYLVWLFHWCNQVRAVTLQTDSARLNSRQMDRQLTVNALTSLKRDRLVLEQAFERQLGLYNHAKGVQVPPRFAQLHYLMQYLDLRLMAAIHESIQAHGLYTPERFKIIEEELKRFHGDSDTVIVLASQEMNRLADQISDTTLNGIWTEASQGNTVVFNAQERGLYKEHLRRDIKAYLQQHFGGQEYGVQIQDANESNGVKGTKDPAKPKLTAPAQASPTTEGKKLSLPKSSILNPT